MRRYLVGWCGCLAGSAIVATVATASPAQTAPPPTTSVTAPSKGSVSTPPTVFGSGDSQDGVAGGETDRDIFALATHVHPGGADAPGGSRCTWTLVDAAPADPLDTRQVWPHADEKGVVHHLYHKVCEGGPDTYVDVPDRNPTDLIPLAVQELKEKQIPKPVANYIVDPKHNWTYVRVPFDFRVTPASWREVSVTARAGPVWVTVTAAPKTLTFDPGDPMWYANPPVTCGGNAPLAPYVPEIPGECAYTFKDSSSISEVDHYHFDTRLSIEWSITWTASTGAGGTLAPFASSSTTPLAVAEIQALTICTGPRPEQGGC